MQDLDRQPSGKKGDEDRQGRPDGGGFGRGGDPGVRFNCYYRNFNRIFLYHS